MTDKKAWLSKTVWFNAFVGLAGVVGLFHPPVQTYVQAHSEAILIGIGLLGALLRFFTKGGIALGD